MSIITCFPSSSSLVNSPLFKELLSDIHCISKSSLVVFTSTSDVFVSWTQPESPSPTLQFVATCFTYRANHNLLHSHKNVDRCLFPLKDRNTPLRKKKSTKESFKHYFKWKPLFAPNLVVTNPNTNQMESESKNHNLNQTRSRVYVPKKGLRQAKNDMKNRVSVIKLRRLVDEKLVSIFFI